MRKGFRWVHTPLERHPQHILTLEPPPCCAVTPPTWGKGGQQAVLGATLLRGRGVCGGLGSLDRKANCPQQLLPSAPHPLPGLET